MIAPATAVANSQRKNSPTHVVNVVHRDTNHRMPCRRECFERTILRFVAPRRKPLVNEHPVVSIYFRRSQRFTIHWDDSLPIFARRFRHQLLQPRT